jgi:hypothetical protein
VKTQRPWSRKKGQTAPAEAPEQSGALSAPKTVREELHTEILILSDGTTLAHHLTPAMAAVMRELNPRDEAARLRAAGRGPLPGHRPTSEASTHDLPARD